MWYYYSLINIIENDKKIKNIETVESNDRKYIYFIENTTHWFIK